MKTKFIIFCSIFFITATAYAGYSFLKEKDNTIARKLLSNYISKEFNEYREEIKYLSNSIVVADMYIKENIVSPDVSRVKRAYNKKIDELKLSVFKTEYGSKNYSFDFIKRSEWGADETFTYPSKYLANCPSGNCWGGKSSDRTETIRTNYEKNFKSQDDELKISKIGKGDAPFDYSPIQQIILHHTAGICPKNIEDEKKEMRSIYRTHALSFGWGDIGYHFLIGPSGTVYEGRAGGAYVEGFHAVGHNPGTIGISLMGDGACNGGYSDLQIKSLRNVTKALVQFYILDISQKTIQRKSMLDGTELGNSVIAHKEIDSGKPVDPKIDMDNFRESLIDNK